MGALKKFFDFNKWAFSTNAPTAKFQYIKEGENTEFKMDFFGLKLYKKETQTIPKMKDVTPPRLENKGDPTDCCFTCDKHIGYRGFCSQDCHDEHYD